MKKQTIIALAAIVASAYGMSVEQAEADVAAASVVAKADMRRA